VSLPAYNALGIGLLRAPILPSCVFGALGDELSDPNQLIDAVEARACVPPGFVREAIRIASPDLWHALGSPGARTLSSVRRYLIRMCTRPTPFGYFAGAAPFRWSRVSGDSSLRLVRAWCVAEHSNEKLALMGDGVEPQHLVFWAPTCRAIAGRLYCDVETVDSVSTRSLRITAAVQSLLNALDTPRPIAAVTAAIAAQFNRSIEVVAAFLQGLLEGGFLVTDRLNRIPLPRHTTPSDQVYLDTSPISDHTPPFLPSVPISADESPGAFIHATEYSVEGYLDRRIAERAAVLASILLSVNGTDDMHARMETYERQFLERYGQLRIIGLTDLVDSGSGLGLPSEQPMYRVPEERDQLLLDLFANGLCTGGCITLTDGDLAKLQAASAGGEWPDSLDVVVNIRPAEGEYEWDFQLAPNPGCIGAGRHASRFCRTNPRDVANLLEDAMEASRQAA